MYPVSAPFPHREFYDLSPRTLGQIINISSSFHISGTIFIFTRVTVHFLSGQMTARTYSLWQYVRTQTTKPLRDFCVQTCRKVLPLQYYKFKWKPDGVFELICKDKFLIEQKHLVPTVDTLLGIVLAINYLNSVWQRQKAKPRINSGVFCANPFHSFDNLHDITNESFQF